MVTGVSRSFSHELVKNSTGTAISQLSQRYVDSKDVAFVVPHDLRDEIKSGQEEWLSHWKNTYFDEAEYNSLWKDHPNIPHDSMIGIEWIHSCAVDLVKYRRMLSHLSEKMAARYTAKTDAFKAARQAARSVLPNATETRIYLSGNARAFRWIIEQRGSRHAEPEIRKFASALLDVLLPEAPDLFGDYIKTPLPDGTYEITGKYRKV